jgi:hypothetical protein
MIQGPSKLTLKGIQEPMQNPISQDTSLVLLVPPTSTSSIPCFSTFIAPTHSQACYSLDLIDQKYEMIDPHLCQVQSIPSHVPICESIKEVLQDNHGIQNTPILNQDPIPKHVIQEKPIFD